MTNYEMLLAISGFNTTALEDLAWDLYCEDTAGDLDVRDYWEQLSVDTKTIYIQKVIQKERNWHQCRW